MAEEFVRLDRFDEYSRRIDERFDHIMRHMDARFDAFDKRFTGLDNRLDRMDKRMGSMIGWLIGLYAVIIATASLTLIIFKAI